MNAVLARRVAGIAALICSVAFSLVGLVGCGGEAEAPKAGGPASAAAPRADQKAGLPKKAAVIPPTDPSKK
jgi:hypothetical protein